MQKTQPFISLLLPCGHNQRAIVETLSVLDAWGSAQKHPYEILMIPFYADARARDFLVRYAALMPHVRVLDYKNLNEGTRIQQALLEARGLIRVWISDPLNVVWIASYPKIEQAFRNGADIVVVRAVLSKKQIGARVTRLLAEWFLQTSIPVPFGVCVAYSQKSTLALLPHVRLHSRGVLSESLIEARKQGLIIREVLSDEKNSRVRILFHDISDIVRLSVGLWINKIYCAFRNRKPVKIR